jgi:hypothetical protein
MGGIIQPTRTPIERECYHREENDTQSKSKSTASSAHNTILRHNAATQQQETRIKDKDYKYEYKIK